MDRHHPVLVDGWTTIITSAIVDRRLVFVYSFDAYSTDAYSTDASSSVDAIKMNRFFDSKSNR